MATAAGRPDYARIAQLEAEIFPEEFTTEEKLRHVRQGIWNEMAAMCNRSATKTANFTREEQGRYEVLNQRIDEIDRRINYVRKVKEATQWQR